MPVHVSTVLFLAFKSEATSFALSWKILIQNIDDRLVPHLQVYIEVNSNRTLKERSTATMLQLTETARYQQKVAWMHEKYLRLARCFQ
jgi:hypothetical protein